DIAALERVEPWLVALTLMDLGMTRLGYRSEQGLEQHLLLRAQRDRKPVYGLESVADQIGVFDRLTSTEQEAMLEQALTELDSAGQEMDELLNAWRDGSLETLTDKLSAAFEEFPGLYESLVVDRNRNWIPEIERLAVQPGRHLVVVGALHLVGEHNVVDLLRERGFEVEPYSLP
ncbi:MAG: TraB/GumN family protein, partial [Gammaproteobacteria bacterium]|nr:TraB/GumN family protein [Gammaproteobacteria bacterium]